MGPPSRWTRALLTELRRRGVLQTAGIYAVGAWLTVQVGVAVFPVLLLPEWALQVLVIVAILGFPVSVVLAWAYDLTPGGRPANAPGGGRPPRASRGRRRPVAADRTLEADPFLINAEKDILMAQGLLWLELKELGRARSLLERTGPPGPGDAWWRYYEALVRLHLDQRDRALALLEEYLALRPDRRRYIASEWWWEPLRAEPRFQRLVAGE